VRSCRKILPLVGCFRLLNIFNRVRQRTKHIDERMSAVALLNRGNMKERRVMQFASDFSSFAFRFSANRSEKKGGWICSVVFSAVLLLGGSGHAMAENPHTSFKSLAHGLAEATRATITLIPLGVSFRVALRDEDLPNVSCVYELQSGGAAFRHLVSILDSGIVSFDAGSRDLFEPRASITFDSSEHKILTLYFEDWGGQHDIKGRLDNYSLRARANLSSQIRELVGRPDVVLIKRDGRSCPG
jgi:hypothetical protein